MEQVLHPEKYLDRVDQPVEVRVSESVGKSPESEGRIGEVYIRALFEPFLPRAQGEEAAAGWGGDHYALWADAEGYRLLWRTVWDTDRDAGEFHQALSQFALERFGQEAEAQSATLSLEGTDGSRTRVTRRGREVVLEREGIR
jgi:hypothetical protein